MARRFYIETLGCPKNQVDSDKIVGTLLWDGMTATDSAADADLVVINTCAFIEEARQESIDTILSLSAAKQPGARVVVTGCMAERYGDELAAALPEVDAVSGFGVPVTLGKKPAGAPVPELDLLNLPRPPADAPWAYVKIAEGCDRTCGFCAIPTFRGPQRSRTPESILAEVDQLGALEIVLVAQDLASYGKDVPDLGAGAIVPLVEEVAAAVPWVRLLYLYPSDLSDGLIDVMCSGQVPYFDLSLQHVSKRLLRRMRRWGDGERFLRRIDDIRVAVPTPRSERTSSSGTRARPRMTTISCSRSSSARSSTGVASSRSRARTARTPPISTGRCRPGSSLSGSASCGRCKTTPPRGSARR